MSSLLQSPSASSYMTDRLIITRTAVDGVTPDPAIVDNVFKGLASERPIAPHDLISVYVTVVI